MGKNRKAKSEKVDGLGPDDLKRIHKLLGQARRWSYPVRLVKKRCMGSDGFLRCEGKNCLAEGKPVPAIQVDHIEPIGEIGGPDYIQKMFVGSHKLQGLCKVCHQKKTNQERKAKKNFTDKF